MTKKTEIISVFNNKGGVGKTTLTFHFAHALAEMGHKVLAVDLDPQCNLSMFALSVDQIKEIWDEEDKFIENPGFEAQRKIIEKREFDKICRNPRTFHFLLKPTEEGTGQLSHLPPPIELKNNLHLIPGRLTLHMFEEILARRWSDTFLGNPLAIRTIGEIRRLLIKYAFEYGYDYIIVDTSPSLGQLNKIILTTVDSFLVPCAPDLFSSYGIKNIGNSLNRWLNEMKILYGVVSPNQRSDLPINFISFLGYVVYNARKKEGSSKWNMAIAHYQYAKEIPNVIEGFIPKTLSLGLESMLSNPLGELSIMHTHNTYPSHAQKYHVPIWELPELNASNKLDSEDITTITTNKTRYLETLPKYKDFSSDVLERISKLKRNPI